MSDLHIRQGRYRHYKGNEYNVHGIALHSETQEPLVFYTSLHDPETSWVRPYHMFVEWVVCQNSLVPRFMYIGPL
ncbi:MAG: DUF1653 domain-containing protein [Patescibacteria group bacterium]